jgi:hypothetical protein
MRVSLGQFLAGIALIAEGLAVLVMMLREADLPALIIVCLSFPSCVAAVAGLGLFPCRPALVPRHVPEEPEEQDERDGEPGIGEHERAGPEDES